jgi:hypothetical protein
LKGNLIVDAFMERAANPGAKQQAARRVPLGTLPAIPFEIVEWTTLPNGRGSDRPSRNSNQSRDR